ncbi:hypothetical protein W97_03180 [Coniosporium apollinis CBS 100218]|uniref:UBC core domain-containing protein n=1 Tax=Coniosporium apollinis (strain CBS 100218) TaxID=1168221 RepID=R7YQJ7_CONA1|nr:uncharacterized protein W97_03180 [Coniosporium apollinis CBS 100218]EON63951.1 hypothetical protein W97_03180 [Coniosporium apollinis CBS 100218]
MRHSAPQLTSPLQSLTSTHYLHNVHPRPIQYQKPHHKTNPQVSPSLLSHPSKPPFPVKEATELATNPSPDLHAEPLESNLFEWHFTIRGPPSPSPYAGGLYHGRIILPSAYPLRPPSFRFMTPSGRFEVNREICLSISGHHEETWQPAWGIRTAMVAIRSFMDTDARGQVGGVDSTREARVRMARESGGWRCAACGKSNETIMRERQEAVRGMEGEGVKKEEVVPEELRLAYREELGAGAGEGQGNSATRDTDSAHPDAAVQAASAPTDSRPPIPASSNTPPPTPTRTITLPPPRPPPLDTNDDVPAWIDKAIYGIIAALLFMVLRKIF